MVVRRLVVVTPACCAPQLPPTLSLGPRSAQHPGQGAVGILWQSCSLLYTSTSVYQYHCTHYTGQPRMWSPAAVSGVVSCAQPGHGAIVITYLNISTIHTQSPPPPPAAALSMLQIFTADPSLSSCSCWPEYPVSKLSNSLAIY